MTAIRYVNSFDSGKPFRADLTVDPITSNETDYGSRGRNEYFRLHTLDVSRLSGRIYIEGWSRRIGDMPPVRLSLSLDDAEALVAALTQLGREGDG